MDILPTRHFTYSQHKNSRPAIVNGCHIYSDHAILAVHVQLYKHTNYVKSSKQTVQGVGELCSRQNVSQVKCPVVWKSGYHRGSELAHTKNKNIWQLLGITNLFYSL